MGKGLKRVPVVGLAAMLSLLPSASFAAPPAGGLAVDYERMLAILEHATDEGPCTVSEQLVLVFYVPTYQPLAPGGRPSDAMPFVDASYTRTDACAGLLESLSGPIEVDGYSVQPLKSAFIFVQEMKMYDASGTLRETFVVDLSWTATGRPIPIPLDPGNDGGVEAGADVDAMLTGSVRGIETNFTAHDAVLAIIGSIHRITMPVPSSS